MDSAIDHTEIRSVSVSFSHPVNCQVHQFIYLTSPSENILWASNPPPLNACVCLCLCVCYLVLHFSFVKGDILMSYPALSMSVS